MPTTQPNIQIEKTADGSPTLYLPAMDEHYHSVKGALTESLHIFIEMGLQHSPAPAPSVLEIGFGTGLNAFLTLLAAEESRRNISYTTLELYPLPEETIRHLACPEQINPGRKDDFYRLHTLPWNQWADISPYMTFCKIEADYTAFSFPANTYDVIYFDAFAPEKQPEMWQQELFNRLFASLRPGGILTTYCAKGSVRRMLQEAGFKVERLAGPPGGKREILRGGKKRSEATASEDKSEK